MSIGEMLSRVGAWVDRHYRILRFLFIAAIALVIAAACVLLLVKPPRVTYAMVISYNFPQAERGFYPNGTPFSVTDVVSAKVLEAVWTKNKLGDIGLTLSRFMESVAIIQYAQNEEFIREKYRAMLQRKNLTQTDVAAIEKDFSDELNAASRKQSRLTLTLPFSSAVSGDIAEKVLADIPRTWSAIAINELGVAAIPGLLTEGISEEFVKSAHPFQLTDYFGKTIDVLGNAVRVMASFPGGDSLRDPKTGLGVDDLRQRLNDVSRYSLQSFDDLVQEAMRIPESQVRSSERSLRELKTRQDELMSQARVHRQALVDYDSVRLQEARTTSQGDPRGTQQSNSIQLQGDSIQRLINLGSQNKDAEFRQELTRKRLVAEVAANALEPQIDRLKRRVEAARKSSGKSDVSSLQAVNALALDIYGRLNEIVDVIRRLQTVQITRFLDDAGLLYRVGTVDSSVFATAKGVVVPPMLMISLLLTGLGFLSAIRRVK